MEKENKIKVIPDGNNILFTVPETAALLKTNTTFVYKLINAGLLPVLKLGRYKIRKESLLDFVAKYEGMDVSDPCNINPINVAISE